MRFLFLPKARYSLVVLLGLLACPAAAQEAVPDPSDVEMPAFDGSVLEPVTLTYDLTLSRAQHTSTRAGTVTITKGTHAGQPSWRVENASGNGGQSSSAVLHLDRSTLHPLAYRTANGTIDVTYDETRVTGTVGGGQHATPIDTTVGMPVLDEKSPNLNVALASLSLEVGQTFSVRTFSPIEPAVHVTTVEVTGTETVDVPAGTFETYVVSLKSSGEQTRTTGTMYLRTAAPHYLVKSDATIQTAGDVSMTVSRALTELTEK